MFSPPREPRISRIHRVFTQLAVVSIRSGASRIICSPATRENPQQKGARREFTRRTPPEPAVRISCLHRIRPRRRTTIRRRTRSGRRRTNGLRSAHRNAHCCFRRTYRRHCHPPPTSCPRTSCRPTSAARRAGPTPSPCSRPSGPRPTARSERPLSPHLRLRRSTPTSRPSVPPKRGPPLPPRLSRVWGMPPPPKGQSRLEQLQSFRAGWQP